MTIKEEKQQRKSGIRRQVLAGLFLLLLLLGAGCSANKEDVELAGKWEIEIYACREYGLCYIQEAEKEEDSITYTMKDLRGGFSYRITSYVQEIGIDNSVFGYTESKSSDFAQVYRDWVLERLNQKLEQDDDMIVLENVFSPGLYFCRIRDCAPEDAEQTGAYLAQKLEKIDRRGYFSNLMLQIYDADGDYLGSYHMSEDRYLCKAEENISTIMGAFCARVNGNSGNSEGITYLSYTEMDISQVPGIEEQELVDHELDDGTTVTVYYFDYNGRTYFMADIRVWEIGDVYYSNYKKS